MRLVPNMQNLIDSKILKISRFVVTHEYFCFLKRNIFVNLSPILMTLLFHSKEWDSSTFFDIIVPFLNFKIKFTIKMFSHKTVIEKHIDLVKNLRIYALKANSRILPSILCICFLVRTDHSYCI